ncbi:MAG: hypothetical protein K5769_06880 [Pseudobutyrivibrio sp.]|nr:hypothetical protein [Pseudobutyrivibrio sp.]
MKTETLYDKDAFAKNFEARVISCDEITSGDKKLFKVVLDATLFFPEQGGQSSDIGNIDAAEVLDVQIENDVIYHYCTNGFLNGEMVTGEIDWTHRFNNMQQHTGEHIFTGIAHNMYGAENVGFHLSDNTVTLDLDTELTEEQIREVEYKANLVIAKDVKVYAYYPQPSVLETIDYRSKKEIEGDVRLVEIEGTDICACCAPHVRTTGQVGLLKVVSFEKYKGGTRVFILCGLRALEDYGRKIELLQQSYQTLNCKEEEIPEKIKGLLDNNKQLKYDISETKAKALMEQIEKYPGDVADITIFTEGLDAKNMRDGVNALVEKHSGLCAIFSGDDEEGYNFVIGSSTRDCSAIAAGLREMLKAKGGGSKQMAQGNVMATKCEIERVL